MKKSKLLNLEGKKEIAKDIVKMFDQLKINPIDGYEIICIIKVSMENALNILKRGVKFNDINFSIINGFKSVS